MIQKWHEFRLCSPLHSSNITIFMAKTDRLEVVELNLVMDYKFRILEK